MNKPLEKICNIMTEVHARIQQDFKHIDPIMGINQKMRTIGIASDVMTIDCIKTQKRIILVLHDEQPDNISYQFCFRDKDPDDVFESILLNNFSEQMLYDWIKTYFAKKVESNDAAKH